MSEEFVRVPKAGKSVEKVVRNPSLYNCRIAHYVNGRFQDYHPATPSNIRLSKPPRGYTEPDEVITSEKEEAVTVSVPEGKLASGVPPFYQLIHRVVRRKKEATADEIFRALAENYRVIDKTKESRKAVENYIEEMHDKAHLLVHKGKFRVGDELETGGTLLDLKEGFDPVEYQIMKQLKDRGMQSFSDLEEYIINTLGWLESPDALRAYIDRLKRKGNVSETFDGNYEREEPLEPY